MMMGSVRRIVGIATIGLMTAAVTGPGAGAAFAEQTPPPVAVITNLTGVFTSVKLDPGFVRALGSLGVAPSPSGKATIADGRPKFPITGGSLTVYRPGDVFPHVQGRVEHADGGLNLTKGDTTVTISDFVIDPGDLAVLTGKVTVNGRTAAESLTLFDLNGSTLKPIMVDTAAGLITLTGTTMTLSDEAAEALGGVFRTDALTGGTPIGIATILVNTTSADMPIPKGGVNTGAGSNSGTEDTGLIVGAGLLLLGVGANGHRPRPRPPAGDPGRRRAGPSRSANRRGGRRALLRALPAAKWIASPCGFSPLALASRYLYVLDREGGVRH